MSIVYDEVGPLRQKYNVWSHPDNELDADKKDYMNYIVQQITARCNEIISLVTDVILE